MIYSRWEHLKDRRVCLVLGLTWLTVWSALLILRPWPPAHRAEAGCVALLPAPEEEATQEEQSRRQLAMLARAGGGRPEASQECLILGPIWLPDQKVLFTATWIGSAAARGVRAADISCVQRRQGGESGGESTVSPIIQMETSSTGQVHILCHGEQEEGASIRLAGMPCGVGGGSPAPWNNTVYSAKVDEEEGVGVYVWAKGWYFSDHLKPGSPCNVSCSYYDPLGKELLEAEATTCGQEVVLCPSLPLAQRSGSEGVGASLWVISLKTQGVQLPSAAAINARNSQAQSGASHGTPRRQLPAVPFAGEASPTVSFAGQAGQGEGGAKRYSVCACTMIYNAARFLPEWVRYHHHIGVEHFFFYDNASDDSTEEAILGLAQNGTSATRVPWPWPKAQQGGFTDCALMARRDCKWVMFADVDEYLYPAKLVSQLRSAEGDAELRATSRGMLQRFLQTEVAEEEQRYALQASSQLANTSGQTACRRVGQVSVACLVFGPSGHHAPPPEGMTLSYTCRLRQSQRHKVFVLTDSLAPPMLNVVHHFEDFKEGFCTLKSKVGTSVFFHYKYPAWDDFKGKFHRRAASYVSDWKENRTLSSQDRTPGLGTAQEKPHDWEQQFCDVPDARMRSLVLRLFPPSTSARKHVQ